MFVKAKQDYLCVVVAVAVVASDVAALPVRGRQKLHFLVFFVVIVVVVVVLVALVALLVVDFEFHFQVAPNLSPFHVLNQRRRPQVSRRAANKQSALLFTSSRRRRRRRRRPLRPFTGSGEAV